MIGFNEWWTRYLHIEINLADRIRGDVDAGRWPACQFPECGKMCTRIVWVRKHNGHPRLNSDPGTAVLVCSDHLTRGGVAAAWESRAAQADRPLLLPQVGA